MKFHIMLNTLLILFAQYIYAEDLSNKQMYGGFHPDTLLSIDINDGDADVENSVAQIVDNIRNYKIIHLKSTSTLLQLEYSSSKLSFSITDANKEPLIVINTVDGRTLKVAELHPILTAEGKLVPAKGIVVTDKLLDKKGNHVGIYHIDKEQYSGPVVNFMVDKSIDYPLEHIIFANNFAVGDLAWQMALANQLNQVIIGN
jgi:hypothetical protein